MPTNRQVVESETAGQLLGSVHTQQYHLLLDGVHDADGRRACCHAHPGILELADVKEDQDQPVFHDEPHAALGHHHCSQGILSVALYGLKRPS